MLLIIKLRLHAAGEEAVDMSYQQQAACNQELGRLAGVLNNFVTLQDVQRELQDLSAVEAESAQDQEILEMAMQERQVLQEKVWHQQCRADMSIWWRHNP